MCASFLRVCMLFVLILIANSCSKDSDPGPDNSDSYYLRFTLDGVKKEYKMFTYVQFKYDQDHLTHNGYVLASLTSDPTKEVLSFFLYSKQEYQKGQEYDVQNEVLLSGTNAKLPQLTMVYIDKDDKSYTAQFPDSPTLQSLGIKHEAKLVFSEITNDHVKGTFSAKVFSEFPEKESLIVTDGEFLLKRN